MITSMVHYWPVGCVRVRVRVRVRARVRIRVEVSVRIKVRVRVRVRVRYDLNHSHKKRLPHASFCVQNIRHGEARPGLHER